MLINFIEIFNLDFSQIIQTSKILKITEVTKRYRLKLRKVDIKFALKIDDFKSFNIYEYLS